MTGNHYIGIAETYVDEQMIEDAEAVELAEEGLAMSREVLPEWIEVDKEKENE